MSVSDDLQQAVTDLGVVQTALTQVASDLNAQPASSPSDSVVSAVVAALEAQGYTVTPPENVTPAPEAAVGSEASA